MRAGPKGPTRISASSAASGCLSSRNRTSAQVERTPKISAPSAAHSSGPLASSEHRLPCGQPESASFQRALVAWAVFLVAAALIGLRATNTKGEPAPAATALLEPIPAPD